MQVDTSREHVRFLNVPSARCSSNEAESSTDGRSPGWQGPRPSFTKRKSVGTPGECRTHVPICGFCFLLRGFCLALI